MYRHKFFGHKSLILKQIELKFFMGAQETIIYRLVMKNPRCLFSNFYFLGHFGVEMGHQVRPLWSWASKPNQKVRPLHTVRTFWPSVI